MKYIDAEKLIAEIERQEIGYNTDGKHTAEYNTCRKILDIISSLQQEPRFPQYDNIVEKVFGAGNLDGWERDEAEILVALAKEELLKSLQQEQPDKETILRICKLHKAWSIIAPWENIEDFVVTNWNSENIV